MIFLQDPDASNEETDELLSKQFAQLGDALGDSVPAVRQAAVSGVCKLLNTFWELIPGAVTAGFLKRVAGAPQMPSLPCVSNFLHIPKHHVPADKLVLSCNPD